MELFKFEGKSVCTLQKEGIVLFDPKEIGECLELSERTIGNKIGDLEDEIEKVHLSRTEVESLFEGTLSMSTPNNLTSTFNNFGKTYLTEAGVYQFVMESRSQKARDFKKWLCREVLPALRKTGTYSVNTPVKAIEPSAREMAIRDWKVYKELGELVQLPLSTIVVEASKIVDKEYGVKFLEFTKTSPLLDHVKSEEEFLEPSELGKKFGLSGVAMNKRLGALGLQARINSEWVPTEEGSKISFRHQWGTGSKSGYNFKWNLSEVTKRISK